MSIHWSIIRSCLRRPLRPLIIDDQRTWRGIDLLVASLHIAGEIDRRSSAKAVGILLPTGGAFPAAATAGWMLGRTVVPLNYLLKPEELQYVIDDSEIDAIITAGPMLEFLDAEPKCEELIRLDEMKFKGVPDLRWPVSTPSEELALLLYTSGTSGKPKGVMLTHSNILSNVRQSLSWAHFTSRDVILGVLPQFHSFGLTVLTVLPLIVGAKVVSTARFVPPRIIKLMRDQRPTAFVGIPSMYNALSRVKSAKPEDFASLTKVVSGGEPLPDDVKKRFHDRFGLEIREGYGLTETSPVTHWLLPDEDMVGSVGRAITGVQQRIVDIETGAEVGPNHDGEIRLKGPNIMKGYFKLPEETAEAFDDEGWFRSGDIGRIDERGYLFITGRLKEMIIVGGENVFPREIEEALNHHPSVKESAVIGVKDAMRGEQPWAWVEICEGSEFDATALRTWCREHMAGYKVPKEIRLIDALPRNPTGKILRRELYKLVDVPARAAG